MRSRRVGIGGTAPNGGWSGLTSGMGIGIGALVSAFWMNTTGIALSVWLEAEAERLDVRVGGHVGVERGLRDADLDLGAPVGGVHAGQRPGVDVEDVADVRGELVDVGEIGPFVGRDALDRDRQIRRTRTG